jgi:hypothetical protein
MLTWVTYKPINMWASSFYFYVRMGLVLPFGFWRQVQDILVLASKGYNRLYPLYIRLCFQP